MSPVEISVTIMLSLALVGAVGLLILASVQSWKAGRIQMRRFEDAIKSARENGESPDLFELRQAIATAFSRYEDNHQVMRRTVKEDGAVIAALLERYESQAPASNYENFESEWDDFYREISGERLRQAMAKIEESQSVSRKARDEVSGVG